MLFNNYAALFEATPYTCNWWVHYPVTLLENYTYFSQWQLIRRADLSHNNY